MSDCEWCLIGFLGEFKGGQCSQFLTSGMHGLKGGVAEDLNGVGRNLLKNFVLVSGKRV